jgi:F0F1-type ATP synthase membrane subunit b/b'
LSANGIETNPLEPSAIVYLVALDQRNVFIYYGADYNASLGPTYKNIADQDMIPQFARSDITGGIVAGINGTVEAIDNPPGSGTNINVGSGTFTPVVLGVIFLVLLFVVGPIAWRGLSKRRAAAQALAKARQDAEGARKQAGAAIADFGQALREAREKAQFDEVSYPAAEVRQLAELQAAAESQFVAAQEAFDQAGERLAQKREPAQDDLVASAGAYRAVTETVAAARAPLDQAEARRAELDKLNAAAPGEVDRAKKALADAAERLAALDQDFANPGAVMRAGAELVARAESLLGEHRAADAITAAGAASAAIDNLNALLARYADLREGLSAGRAGAQKAAEQGYRVEAGLAAFDTAEERLRQAAAALERDVDSAGALLDAAEAARAEGVARGGGMPALRQDNDERLAKVQQAGEQIDAHIAEGRRAFDIVDEFAESTWSDIRGNGSEAEDAAARAREFWEQATRRNTMEEQDFLGAKEDLDAADQNIAYARQLVDAILQRLKDLEAARDAARQDVAEAQADVEQGWGFVRSNDPDVGKDPERALGQAEELLKQAGAELARDRPNWLAIVKQAHEANLLADQAIANARSEVEAMNRLRAQAQHAQQVATAEVQKIIQFLSIHGDDVPEASERKITALQSDVQGAYAAIQSAERDEETTRAGDLRDAIARYTALQTSAEALYAEIYAAFQRLDDLRKRVTSEVQRAAAAVASAERLRQAYAAILARSEGVRLLQQAQAALQSIGSPRGEQALGRALQIATDARANAERAEQLFRQQVRMHQPASQGDLGDFLGASQSFRRLARCALEG